MSDNKNGLFDSDDEDDVQYNPDEGEPEENLELPPDFNFLVKTAHVSLPAPAPIVETKSKDCSSQKAIAF